MRKWSKYHNLGSDGGKKTICITNKRYCVQCFFFFINATACYMLHFLIFLIFLLTLVRVALLLLLRMGKLNFKLGQTIFFLTFKNGIHFYLNRQVILFQKYSSCNFESYTGNKTKEYDDLAMKYLSYVLFLLVACSSAYSLKYERHKSWYSWILSSLTSCVYMFGKLQAAIRGTSTLETNDKQVSKYDYR